jgi:hypothetical protein
MPSAAIVAATTGSSAARGRPERPTDASTASSGTRSTSCRFSTAICSWSVRLMAAYTARSITQSLPSADALTVAARGAE